MNATAPNSAPRRVHRRRPLVRAALAVAAIASFVALTSGSVQADRARPGVPADRAGGLWAVPLARPAAGPTALGLPAPTRVRIPVLDIDAPLDPLRLDATGALEVPRDFARPGWYADGTPPGDVGPAVIAGHVDSWNGPAVFARLHELRDGDLVEVARGDRWVRFRTVAIGQYLKNQFPTAEVYGPTPDPQLRLITCGGAFDQARRSYVDNLVIYAIAA